MLELGPLLGEVERSSPRPTVPKIENGALRPPASRSILEFAGYDETVTSQSMTMTRRTLSSLLLVALFAGMVHLPGARVMACRMDAPVDAAPPVCGSCATTVENPAAPTLAAGSCCRFAPSEEAPALPVWTSAQVRSLAGPDLQPVVTVSPSHSLHRGAPSAELAFDSSPNTPARQSLSTHLRL